MSFFLFSLYFSINLLFPQTKFNEYPGIGQEFSLVSKIKKVYLYFDYSDIEVSSGTGIFVKNFEVGIFHRFLIRDLVVFSLFPGIVYAIKQKESFKEKGTYYALNFLITASREIFPFIGLKVFWDGKYFLNYLKLGIILEL
ncbi:MAG: hypothetical protein ABDH49_06065 [Candidatus Hydrothermales bacterium]